MNFATAEHYAKVLSLWIEPVCADIECQTVQIAGSIRRGRPVCNDVDIVVIPEVIEERDMFGTVIKSTNLLHEFLKQYVAANATRANAPKFQSGGEVVGKSVILQLPKCQLDLWFATPETFATRLMWRTGSREHNIWLASRALRMGMKWNPYEGLMMGAVGSDEGRLQRFETETALYAALDLPFIEPQNRERDWLVKNFGE